MAIRIRKHSKWIILAVIFPALLLFQNCGSTSGGEDSDGGSGSSSAQSRSRTSGHSPYGGGSGSGGSNGTFIGGNSSGGGSSGGSSSGGGSTSGGGNGSSSNGGSSTGGSSTAGGTSGRSDGQNCFDDDGGYYGLEKSVWDLYHNNSNTHINILRAIPLKEKRLIYGDVGFQLQFPEARHGEAITFTCGFSFDKLKKYFPGHYTSGFGNWVCDTDESPNVTTYQCRHGEWYFAGSSCKCTFINNSDR